MCWLSHWPEWSLSTSRRSLVFSRLRFPPRGSDGSDESIRDFDMVRGLVPSMVRCKGWAILSWWKDWFLPCQMWVLIHSHGTVGLVPTWSDISAEFHSWNGGTWLVTVNTQSGIEGDSNVTIGLVPTWSDISVEPFWCDCGMCSHMIGSLEEI